MRKLLAIIAVILVALGVILVVTGDDDGDKTATVTTRVDSLDGNPDQDLSIVVPGDAIKQATQALSGDVDPAGALTQEDADHTGLKDESPEGVSPETLREIRDYTERNRRTTDALPTAGATSGFKGCKTAFVRNQSSRRGVRPKWQVLHYTVSANRPGRADVNAITAFFNVERNAASSHFVIDQEGNCNYIVPIEQKAWTQAAANPFSVSYEIINTGSETPFMRTPGYAKLRLVMRDVARRIGAPLRRGNVSNCSSGTSGILHHKDFGICGGGHHDIAPFAMLTALQEITRRNPAASLRLEVLTPAERRSADCLLRERKIARRAGGFGKADPSHRRKAQECKSRLTLRRTELQRLGVTSKAQRAARFRTIGAVIRRR